VEGGIEVVPALTPEEHRQRHIELHKALDELFADYIGHHPEEHHFLDMPFRKLLDWSAQQMVTPTAVERSGDKPK
jgi:hypothetical protein